MIFREGGSPDQVERTQNLERVAAWVPAIVEDLSDLASAVVHVRDRAVGLVLDPSAHQVSSTEVRPLSVLEENVREILEDDDDLLVH